MDLARTCLFAENMIFSTFKPLFNFLNILIIDKKRLESSSFLIQATSHRKTAIVQNLTQLTYMSTTTTIDIILGIEWYFAVTLNLPASMFKLNSNTVYFGPILSPVPECPDFRLTDFTDRLVMTCAAIQNFSY